MIVNERLEEKSNGLWNHFHCWPLIISQVPLFFSCKIFTCQKRKSEIVVKTRKYDDKILDWQEEMRMALMPSGSLR